MADADSFKQRPTCICGNEDCSVLTNAFGALDRVRGSFVQLPPTNTDIKTNKKKIGLFVRKIYLNEFGKRSEDLRPPNGKYFIAAHHFHPKLLKKATRLDVEGYMNVISIPRNLSTTSAQQIQVEPKVKVPGTEGRYFCLPDYANALLDLRLCLKHKNTLIRNTMRRSVEKMKAADVESSHMSLDTNRTNHTTFTAYSDLQPIEELTEVEEDDYRDDGNDSKESIGTDIESEEDALPEWRANQMEEWKWRLANGENRCLCQSRKCFAISLLCEITNDPRGSYTRLPSKKGEGRVFRNAFLDALGNPPAEDKKKEYLIALHHFNPLILQRARKRDDGLFVLPKSISNNSAAEYNLPVEKPVPGLEGRFFCLPTHDASKDLSSLFIV